MIAVATRTVATAVFARTGEQWPVVAVTSSALEVPRVVSGEERVGLTRQAIDLFFEAVGFVGTRHLAHPPFVNAAPLSKAAADGYPRHQPDADRGLRCAELGRHL